MQPPGFGAAGELLRRATVEIRSGRQTSGSGVIYSADGAILTNAHVAGRGHAQVTLWDGATLEAEVVTADLRKDLALLRVARDGLPAAKWRDSGGVSRGELAIAAGNPLGFVGALSVGVVHTLGPYPGMGRRSWVQAAIRLAPGNSGGPLGDADGNVIGINTMVANGLGLAIPSSTAARFVERGPGPQLGVTIRPVPVWSEGRAGLGLLVLEVAKTSPAETVSLRPGDLLLAADGHRFEAPEDLGEALEHASGPVPIDFLRGRRDRLRRVTVAGEHLAGAA